MLRPLRKLFLRHVLNRSLLAKYDLLKAKLQYLVAPPEPVADILPKANAERLSRRTVAIVALIQQGKVCSNLLYMLDRMVEQGMAVIVLNNGRLAAAEAQALAQRVALYHERQPGLGRDFASFKLGVNLIQELEARGGAPFERYLFANDSVLVVPGSFDRFLQRHLLSARPWVGVTDSSASVYHVSSWFFSVSREVWTHLEFGKYWRGYRPLNSRTHAIKAGELGLSSALRRARFPADVEYPPSRFIEPLRSMGWQQLVECVQLLPSHFHREHLQRLLANGRGPADAEAYRALVVAQAFLDQEGTNVTAYWQLLSVLEMDFPFVKKDIYYRGVFSIAQMQLFADRFVNGDEHRRYIVDRLLAVPDPAALSGVARLRWQFGLE
jgi:hypothetical protein